MTVFDLVDLVNLENGIQFSSAGFVANNDTSVVIDLQDYGFFSVNVGVVAVRTAGSTDVINAAIQGSIDNSTWTDLQNVTSSTTPVNTFAVGKIVRFIRLISKTVGSGNTLTIYGIVNR